MFLYGVFQLFALFQELSNKSDSITIAGLFVLPAVILSVLRMSIGRIALSFMAVLCITWVVLTTLIELISGEFNFHYELFDVILFVFVLYLLGPGGRWERFYSRCGVFTRSRTGTITGVPHTSEAVSSDTPEIDQVQINFSNYCKMYLIKVCNLLEEQASLLLLDPELGNKIDDAKPQWLWEDVGVGEDVDKFLVPPRFDAPEMKRINVILDRFAAEYSQREKPIIDYLKSIGYL